MKDRKIIVLTLLAFMGTPVLWGSLTAPLSQQLPRTSLSIGAYQLDVAMATNEAAREEGLMKKKILGENEGMLFVFPYPQRVAFWMKDTSLALSVAYLNASGRILEIHDLEPLNEHSILSSSSRVVYTVETPRGWFERHHILPGDFVTGLPLFSSAK